MPKKMHPAEKLVRAMDLWGYKTYEQKQKIVVQHIKPLLNVLKEGQGHTVPAETCKACELLEAWSAKL